MERLLFKENAARKFFHHVQGITGKPPPKGFEPPSHDHHDVLLDRNIVRSHSAHELGRPMPDARAFDRALVLEGNRRHDADMRHQGPLLEALRRIEAPPGTWHDREERIRYRSAHPGKAQHLDDAAAAARRYLAHDGDDHPQDGLEGRLQQHRALLPHEPAPRRARQLRRTASAGDPGVESFARFHPPEAVLRPDLRPPGPLATPVPPKGPTASHHPPAHPLPKGAPPMPPHAFDPVQRPTYRPNVFRPPPHPDPRRVRQDRINRGEEVPSPHRLGPDPDVGLSPPRYPAPVPGNEAAVAAAGVHPPPPPPRQGGPRGPRAPHQAQGGGPRPGQGEPPHGGHGNRPPTNQGH